MIKSLLILPLFIVLSMGGNPLAAQSAQTEPSQESTSQESDKTDAARQAIAPKGSAQKKTPPTADNDSPFDYRSSEKISEDVPVSFPVDI